MSKLIKKLTEMHENAARPMGFRQAREEPTKKMVLIACLAQDNRDGAARLAGSDDVDALLVRSHDLQEAHDLEQVGKDSGSTPWGLWLDEVAEGCQKQLLQAGADFLVFEASSAPATLLLEEDLGKVLKVDLPDDESTIGAADQLSIDAVLLKLTEEGGSLTVSELMQCRWLADVVDGPLMVAVRLGLSDEEVRSLWEAGVRGLVVEVGREDSLDRLAELSQATKSLTSAPRRPGQKRAVLPRLEYEPSDLDDD
jgi:hypothetical protein